MAVSIYNDIDADKLLKNLLECFQQQLLLKPCCAIEFEFYALNIDNSTLLDDIRNFASNRGILINHISKESSNNQYEIAMQHSFDIEKLIRQYLELKTIILDLAQNYNLEINFAGKPFGNDSHGNGMHIHISLHDQDGNNLYAKSDNTESSLLLNSIAGLLEHMNTSLVLMNDNPDDFLRYKSHIDIDNNQKRYSSGSSYAPTHVCWGKNNRTTAIRIPDSFKTPESRHIEYRVATPNANPYLVISAILLQIKMGIDENLVPEQAIYGNAYDKQYNLPRIISNNEEALKAFEISTFKQEFNSLLGK